MSQDGQPSPGPGPSAVTSMAVSAAWRAALPALVLVLALILLAYRETVSAMVTIWSRSGTFAHCYVVPPIVLWLVWRRREELALLTPRPSMIVLFPIAGVAFLWLLGDLVAVNSITQLAVVAMLVLAVPAVLGMAVARAITFPLAFLFFAVPIGEFLMPQLMDWTANITIVALRLTGIPVYREGMLFVIPSGTWSVVGACSGVRYLIASLTVGTLFAYLNYHSTKRRIYFILVSILVPIVANWIRAYLTVLLGHLSGNRLAVGFDHIIYGWVFFGIVIMVMFAIGARWSEPEQATATVDPSSLMGAAAQSAAKLWITTACLALLVASPVASKWMITRGVAANVPGLVAPGVLAADWRVTDHQGLTGFKPNFENPTAEINRSYRNAEQVVGLYLGYYRDQNYSRKLVSSNNVLVSSEDPAWTRVTGGTRVAVFGAQQATVRTAELLRMAPSAVGQGERLIAWQIYWVNGTLTTSDYLAKAYSAGYRLVGRGDDSAVIVVYTEKAKTGGAEVTLESFLSANYVAIDALLRQSRAGK